MASTDQAARGVETTRIAVPADARYARVVRMTAANVASIGAFSVDDVDDIRMAAEEAFVYAIATGIAGQLSIDFALSGGALSMRFPLGARDAAEQADDDTTVEYARLLLEALCDECRVDEDDATLTLVKRAAGTGNADAR